MTKKPDADGTESNSVHDRILGAAATVYGRHGYAGTTTKRIALEAGVNEVTLFRQFVSKEELLTEAVGAALVPNEPGPPWFSIADAESALTEWCEAQLRQLPAHREILRQSFADGSEHPDIGAFAKEHLARKADELRAYVSAMAAEEVAAQEVPTAVAVFLSSILCHAVGGDMLPEAYIPASPHTARRLTRAFLRLLRR